MTNRRRRKAIFLSIIAGIIVVCAYIANYILFSYTNSDDERIFNKLESIHDKGIIYPNPTNPVKVYPGSCFQMKYVARFSRIWSAVLDSGTKHINLKIKDYQGTILSPNYSVKLCVPPNADEKLYDLSVFIDDTGDTHFAEGFTSTTQGSVRVEKRKSDKK